MEKIRHYENLKMWRVICAMIYTLIGGMVRLILNNNSSITTCAAIVEIGLILQELEMIREEIGILI